MAVGDQAQVWLRRALDARARHDAEGEVAALDALLALEPRNLAGLLMRGDGQARAGDVRAASSFFQAALAAASNAGPIAPALAAGLDRARAYLVQSGKEYEAWLLDRLSGPLAQAGPRFGEAIDILLGRRQIYLQQPSAFYFPGLPQVQFYDRADFSWAAALEAQTDAIEAELRALIEHGAEFAPYVEQEPGRPPTDFHGMGGDRSWSALYLWKDGTVVAENAERCPRTMAALSKLPLSRIGLRTPVVLFSRLDPGTHIPPHYGMLNARLVCHLPLIVPPGGWLRVGNETREWERGKLLVFDDSIEHEARNPSSETRIVLIFDVWRPELSEAERGAVSAVFDAIDAFGTQGRA